MWADGKPYVSGNFSQWFRDEPDRKPTGEPEYCTYMRKEKGDWFDEKCSEAKAFICQTKNPAYEL